MNRSHSSSVSVSQVDQPRSAARVIDQNVDAAKCRCTGPDQSGDILGDSHVGRLRRGLATARLDLARHEVDAFLRHIAQNDRRACIRQTQRDGPADAACGPGDERDFPG